MYTLRIQKNRIVTLFKNKVMSASNAPQNNGDVDDAGDRVMK